MFQGLSSMGCCLEAPQARGTKCRPQAGTAYLWQSQDLNRSPCDLEVGSMPQALEP